MACSELMAPSRCWKVAWGGEGKARCERRLWPGGNEQGVSPSDRHPRGPCPFSKHGPFRVPRASPGQGQALGWATLGLF